MAYTVLARRYRSQTFDDVIGQEHVAQTLKRAIETDRVAHAYLFCGTRGVGKTSMARILARALNCQAHDKPTPSPCGKCESCLSISRGESMDVIEIDAASNRGIDNIRDLISNAHYRPAIARFKIYIIDEVHGLSKDAFNALLKVLEEPPSHVKFILATTEPEKVLPTILSRCQRYDFRNIGAREIVGHLAQICAKEKVKADEDALFLIAKAGAGSMRDALSLLDRMLSAGESTLTLQMVEQLLGLPRAQVMFDLAGAIGAGDPGGALRQTEAILTSGMSADTLIGALIDHFRNLLVLRVCGKDSDLVEAPGISKDDLATQAGQFDPAVLTQDITLLEELRRQLRSSQAGRALFDATVVRLSLAEQFSSIGDLLSGIDRAGADDAQKKNGEPAATVSTHSFVPIRPPASQPLSQGPPNRIERTAEVDSPAPPAKAAETSLAPSRPDLENSNVEALSTDQLGEVWELLKVVLSKEGPGYFPVMASGQLVEISENQAIIRYAHENSTHAKLLERNGKREALQQAMGTLLKRDIGIKIEISEPEAEPAPDRASTTAAPPARAERLAVAPPVATREPPAAPPVITRATPEDIDAVRDESPLVKALMDSLGAEVLRIE